MSRRSSVVVGFAALLMLGAGVPRGMRSAPADEGAIARGRVEYQQHCAACHGKHGKGDGPAASTLANPPVDLTLLSQKNGAFFRAQIASAVRGTDPRVVHRAPGMMVGGARFRVDARGNEAEVDARIDDLVAFLDTIQQR